MKKTLAVEGSVPDWAQAGDLVFVRSKSVIGLLIRAAQWVRWKHCPYNHVACLDQHTSAGGWTVIQAVGRGVTNGSSLDDISPGGRFTIVPLPGGANRSKFLAFMRSQVGAKYGFLTVASIAFNIVTPRVLCIRQAGSWVCSAVVAGGLLFSGWEAMEPVVERDIYQWTPAEAWETTIPKGT